MTNATVIDEQHAYLQLQASANNLGGDFTAAEANARVEVDALIALLTFVLLRFMCVSVRVTGCLYDPQAAAAGDDESRRLQLLHDARPGRCTAAASALMTQEQTWLRPEQVHHVLCLSTEVDSCVCLRTLTHVLSLSCYLWRSPCFCLLPCLGRKDRPGRHLVDR